MLQYNLRARKKLKTKHGYNEDPPLFPVSKKKSAGGPVCVPHTETPIFVQQQFPNSSEIPVEYVNDEPNTLPKTRGRAAGQKRTWTKVRVHEVESLLAKETWLSWTSSKAHVRELSLELYLVKMSYLDDPEQRIFRSKQYKFHLDGSRGIDKDAMDLFEEKVLSQTLFFLPCFAHSH